jgi:glutamyl-tRNA reductase
MLTTCNRIELYACVSGEDVANGRQLLMNYLGAHHSADVSELREYLYYYQGQPAIEHLVRVSCGLDSQILGEPQILGQVTTAFMKAVEAGTIGPALTALFRGAIRAGKRARADTEISSNPLSIGSASITLADKLIGPLHRRNVLVVGLGEMGQLAINALHKRGVQQIALANRTRARAEELAKSWNGAAYGLDELSEAISRADVVITATAAPETIVDVNLIKRAMNGRGHRDLVIIDIALPRNVSSDARNVPRVHLFNMDDLRQTLDGSLEARRREIPRVEAIISQELSRLQREFKELAISPTIVDLRQKAEAIRQQELQRTLRYIGDDVDPQTLRHIQLMTRALVNKLLHEPTTRLRKQASNGNAERYAETVRDLFDLDLPGNGDAGSNE